MWLHFKACFVNAVFELISCLWFQPWCDGKCLPTKDERLQVWVWESVSSINWGVRLPTLTSPRPCKSGSFCALSTTIGLILFLSHIKEKLQLKQIMSWFHLCFFNCHLLSPIAVYHEWISFLANVFLLFYFLCSAEFSHTITPLCSV